MASRDLRPYRDPDEPGHMSLGNVGKRRRLYPAVRKRGEPARQADQMALVVPKLRIDVVTQDELAPAVAEAIATAVHTGAVGDGKIWVCPVESVLRVRTGERDRDAL
jgi:nitrogen regulatory protein PII